jgi:hypothetical protein
MLKMLLCQRQQGDFGGSFKHSKDPSPPTNLHEYQNTGLAEIAFRKSLILKDAIWLLGQLRVRGVGDVRKAGASSRTPRTIIYKMKYSTNKENVKAFFLFGINCGVSRH